MHSFELKSGVRRTGSSQRGVAAVEMALMLPFLLIFLVGLLEFSILIHDKAVITNASREGARFGISAVGSHPTDAQINTWVDNYVSQRLISFANGSKVTTKVTRFGAASGSALRVRVSYPYDFLVFPNLSNAAPGPTFTLGARTEMRLE